MPNKNYLAGRRFEYETMKTSEKKGWTAIRASGSHGPFDVILYKSGAKVNMVQCKVVSTEAKAKKLLEDFLWTTTPEVHYHQTMSVKVKGIKTPKEVTV